MKKIMNSHCPYCCRLLGQSIGPEIEHFIPNAIYTENVPKNERPTVLACNQCNREKGKLDQYWFITMALCTPDGDIYNDIRNRALRSLDPDQVKSRNEKGDRDRRARVKLRDEIFSRMHTVAPGKENDINPMPTLTIPEAGPNGERGALTINAESYEKWVRFLVRGAWTFLHQTVLPMTHDIEVFYVKERDKQLKEWAELGMEFVPIIDMGVSFQANARDNKEAQIMVIELIILENFYCYAFIGDGLKMRKAEAKRLARENAGD